MITADRLLAAVDEPETHRKIVGNYGGQYALGVQENPPAFVLRVAPPDIHAFPEKIHVYGEEVPVLVKGGFQEVKPLRALAKG
jgi:hypothetical protein